MSAGEAVALICHTLPSLGPLDELLAMPAEVPIWLMASYCSFAARQVAASRAAAPAARDEDGTWEDLGGGKRRYKIRSMDTLVGVMQSRGGVL